MTYTHTLTRATAPSLRGQAIDTQRPAQVRTVDNVTCICFINKNHEAAAPQQEPRTIGFSNRAESDGCVGASTESARKNLLSVPPQYRARTRGVQHDYRR